jgi:vitamin B12 transporter
MVRKRFYSILLAIYVSTALFAAGRDITDTTLTLNEVIVKSYRLKEFGIGLKVQQIDTLDILRYSNVSLAELITKETSISVKTYGYGGLATMSVRGGGAKHTSIIWNGLNLQSPMNGSYNLSTIPVSFIDEINIQQGNAATLFGSGSNTGSIHLDNSIKFNQSLRTEIGGSYGSYSTYSEDGKVGYSTNNIATAFRFSHRSGENNFTFTNNEKFGHPVDTLKHAAYAGYSVLQQNAVRIASNSVIKTDFWLLKFDKKIPSLMSDMFPGANQQTDESIRASINSFHYFSDLQINTRIGLLNDEILYNNDKSHSLSFIGEVEGKYEFNKRHKVNLGINYTFETANSEGYIDNPRRKRASVFASYVLSAWDKRISSVLNFREEMVNNVFNPFVCSWGNKIQSIPGLFIKSNISKNYALPTFNDLYWAKSTGVEGNPDLKPESGYSMEAGIEYNHTSNHLSINSEVSIYKSIINNWISWILNDKGIWKPENFDKGLTKGIDLFSEQTVHYSGLIIRISETYTYTQAEPIKAGEELSSYAGKQMIYVPRHKASGNLLIGWKTYHLSYQHSYISKRYTSPDLTIDPYQLGESFISKDWEFDKVSVHLFFKIDNLWNTSYQITQGYAMPGRSYSCGLNFKFHSK